MSLLCGRLLGLGGWRTLFVFWLPALLALALFAILAFLGLLSILSLLAFLRSALLVITGGLLLLAFLSLFLSPRLCRATHLLCIDEALLRLSCMLAN
eukprot:SAG11_NODE_2666_length_3114_cov_6.157877_3_plen_97_part_00